MNELNITKEDLISGWLDNYTRIYKNLNGYEEKEKNIWISKLSSYEYKILDDCFATYPEKHKEYMPKLIEFINYIKSTNQEIKEEEKQNENLNKYTEEEKLNGKEYLHLILKEAKEGTATKEQVMGIINSFKLGFYHLANLNSDQAEETIKVFDNIDISTLPHKEIYFGTKDNVDNWSYREVKLVNDTDKYKYDKYYVMVGLDKECKEVAQRPLSHAEELFYKDRKISYPFYKKLREKEVMQELFDEKKYGG